LATDYDYVVINDDLEETVQNLRSIVAAERCRRERYSQDFIDRFIDGK
jgi:guanylate kinase